MDGLRLEDGRLEDKLEGFEYRNENHGQLPLKPEVGEPETKKNPRDHELGSRGLKTTEESETQKEWLTGRAVEGTARTTVHLHYGRSCYRTRGCQKVKNTRAGIFQEVSTCVCAGFV